jgi:xanthine dehydrogenase accessory factor
MSLRGNVAPVDLAREVVGVLDGARGRAALATVVGRAGSAPQIVGAKLLMHEDSTVVGTVGGGALEASVLEACRACLREGRSRRVEHHLVRDLGMCCGGRMEIFVEYLQPEPRLVLIGAGHVAQALAPLAAAAGFRVTVCDDREALLADDAFSGATTACLDVDELDELDDLSARDYVLIVTRDHARDERALATLLRRPHRYLGMIGSRRKVHTVLRRIEARDRALGRPPADLSRLRAPVGLALGGRTPGEIAVSILAELVADRHGGDGRPMSIVAEAQQKLEEREPKAAVSADD